MPIRKCFVKLLSDELGRMLASEGGIRAPVKLPSWYIELSQRPCPDRAQRVHGAAGGAGCGAVLGAEVRGGVHGNGDGTWEPCPGSDTDPRLLGQQAAPLPPPALLHVCLEEQRRKMQNCFLLSASHPELLPLAGALHRPVWGFMPGNSQTFNCEAARCGRRMCLSLTVVMDQDVFVIAASWNNGLLRSIREPQRGAAALPGGRACFG